MNDEIKDLCITCGKEVPYKEFGRGCKEGHKTVHPHNCSMCGRICGQLTDDDYCGPEILVCPDCMDECRSIVREEK